MYNVFGYLCTASLEFSYFGNFMARQDLGKDSKYKILKIVVVLNKLFSLSVKPVTITNLNCSTVMVVANVKVKVTPPRSTTVITVICN